MCAGIRQHGRKHISTVAPFYTSALGDNACPHAPCDLRVAAFFPFLLLPSLRVTLFPALSSGTSLQVLFCAPHPSAKTQMLFPVPHSHHIHSATFKPQGHPCPTPHCQLSPSPGMASWAPGPASCLRSRRFFLLFSALTICFAVSHSICLFEYPCFPHTQIRVRPEFESKLSHLLPG